MGARRVQAPFEDVSRNSVRARHLAIVSQLIIRADVDEKGAARNGLVRLLG